MARQLADTTAFFFAVAEDSRLRREGALIDLLLPWQRMSRPSGEGLTNRPHHRAGSGTAAVAVAMGGTGPCRARLGFRGVAMARDCDRPGTGVFLRIQCETWQEDSREDAEQTTYPTTVLVCPRDLQVILAALLEDLVGELASAAYLLLSLAPWPQGTSSGELVAADRSGGAVPDLSRGRGVTKALPLGLYTRP